MVAIFFDPILDLDVVVVLVLIVLWDQGDCQFRTVLLKATESVPKQRFEFSNLRFASG